MGATKPYKFIGFHFDLVYRAEHRCKLGGAPAETFPGPPGTGLGREAAPQSSISDPPTEKHLKPLLTALVMTSRMLISGAAGAVR